MKTQIESMADARTAVAAEIRAIVAEAALSRRSLTSDDEARIAELDARYDDIKAEESRLRDVERRLGPRDPKIERILAVMNRTNWTPREEPAARDPIREMIRESEPTRQFAPATSDVTRALPDLDWTAPAGRLDNVVASRAISDFADAESLFVNDFMKRVAIYQRTLSPWLRLATVIDADNGRPMVLPNLTGDAVAYTPGEGTAITPSDPTLGGGTVVPTSYKAMTYISWEAWEDETVNLSDLVARSHARSISLGFGSDATTAVLAAINNGGTATGLGGGGTATYFGYEDMLDLEYGRAAPYRERGAWIMSNGAIKKGRKWRDVNGQYLWQPTVLGGQPDTFEGAPVFEDPYLAAPGSATRSVIYGDASTLVIKASALRVNLSDSFRFDTDQIAIRTVQRIGIGIPDPAGLAYLVSANS